jgi:signal transduction histidine kinase/DNA-binding response OmpR family regulator
VTPARERPLVTVAIRREPDVVVARQRARQVAAALGLAAAEQTRFATAVSEIARNAWKYAGGGKVVIAVEPGPPGAMVARVSDEGPGVAHLDEILSGRYRSPTGMGLGIVGSRRLVDRFEVRSGKGGTTVVLAKELPEGVGPRTAKEIAALGEELERARPHDALEELTQQNQELLRTLDALRERERELVSLNRELEDTNRGVVALYAELDEKADYLRRASELKSRFLSNMSHEFRTPLTTVISFCRLLLDETDGPLNGEQRRQVEYARRAAEGMLELVNDLLDLARVEAGKTVIRPAPFEVAELFGALRGMLRPLLVSTQVALVFEEPSGIPTLQTDEQKISQVLRNLLSNALKFTERGEVRVSARFDGERVVFAVKDTGIGIAPEDQGRIFDEYTQVESPVQRKVKGTGLGLPLSRRLAELLGGRLTVESAVGAGSTFTLEVPAVYRGAGEAAPLVDVARLYDTSRFPVLVVEDNPETVFVYEKYVKGTPFQVLPVSTLVEARRVVRRLRPAAVILDLMLGNESAWPFMEELKGDPSTRDLPLIVITMVANEARALAQGADAFAEKPVERAWLLERLRKAVDDVPREEVLVVDDDESSRYILRSLLAETRYDVREAASGEEGLRLAAERPFAAVFLDWKMPGLDGGAVLARLRADEGTRELPVIVWTGEDLGPAERARAAGARAILSKSAPRPAALQHIREVLARVGTTATTGSPS